MHGFTSQRLSGRPALRSSLAGSADQSIDRLLCLIGIEPLGEK